MQVSSGLRLRVREAYKKMDKIFVVLEDDEGNFYGFTFEGDTTKDKAIDIIRRYIQFVRAPKTPTELFREGEEILV